MTTNEVVNAFPTPAEFLLNMPLYETVAFPEGKDRPALAIFNFAGPLDSYCPECQTHSIFRRDVNLRKMPWGQQWMQYESFDVEMYCTRDHDHQLRFIVHVDQDDRTMQKIGQIPSLADLSMHDVKKYSGVLGKETFRELTKAIGLAAHGVGIGSFVYLRRIFENLVEDAHQAAKTAKVWVETGERWDEEAYEAARMNDKIQMLKGHLPDFLVENRVIYGILSKGIHELSEKECLAAFPAVKLGIEIILDAKLEEVARRKKQDAAKKSIQALAAGHDKQK